MKIGVFIFSTEYSIRMVKLARALEETRAPGFVSLAGKFRCHLARRLGLSERAWGSTIQDRLWDLVEEDADGLPRVLRPPPGFPVDGSD